MAFWKEIHRIPNDGPVYVLHHGLFCDSTNWLTNSRNESLAYILADHGFDVWMPNSRGTKYRNKLDWSNQEVFLNPKVDLSINLKKSKSHVRLEPSSPEFWNWSFEEMAEFDLPAVLNYIKHQTRKKIHYVGHSQGGMIGIVALQNPKVSHLIRKADFLGKFSMWLLVIKLEKFNLKTCQSTSSFYLTSEGSSIQIHCSIHKKLEVKWSASSR